MFIRDVIFSADTPEQFTIDGIIVLGDIDETQVDRSVKLLHLLHCHFQDKDLIGG